MGWFETLSFSLYFLDFKKKLEQPLTMNLNHDEDQANAVNYSFDKPLIIQAGPGSGKTETILNRVYHMVKNDIKPDSICMITFSKKAKEEMESRMKVFSSNWNLFFL